MLNTRKLALCVLPNDSKIHIVVPVGDGREGVAQIDVGVEIKMLVEFMVIVVLGKYSFLWHHHSQQNTFVALQQFSLLHVFKNEVVDDLELDWNVRCLKDIQNRS